MYRNNDIDKVDRRVFEKSLVICLFKRQCEVIEFLNPRATILPFMTIVSGNDHSVHQHLSTFVNSTYEMKFDL